jgi:hypothetical protein
MKGIHLICIILYCLFIFSPSTVNATVKYFGFILTDVGWDDPNDGASKKTNYVDEVASFANTGDIMVTSPTDNIVGRLQLMKNNNMSAILHLHELLFQQVGTGGSKSGVLYDLRPDYKARWTTFVSTNKLTANTSLIRAFYIGEEPVWNDVSFAELKSATDYVKSTIPSIPIMVVEAFASVNSLQVPTSVDWLGFDVYAIKDPFNDTEYRNLLDTLKSKRSTLSQKLVIVMDSHYIPSAHGTWGGLAITDMASVMASYYKLALAEPDTIALLGYFWPDGFDHPTSKGARSLPQNAKDEYQRIGKLITGKTTDTIAPSTPGTPNASAINSIAINLNWAASNDNTALTGYRIERCTGALCTSFIQIGTVNTATFSSTGLLPNTVYNYRIRAFDAAGNLSPYSKTATISTKKSATLSKITLSSIQNSNTPLGFSNVNTTVSQSFKLPTAATITKINIRIKKKGNPSTPITIALRSSLTGANLATGTLSPSVIGTTMGQITIALTGAHLLTAGTTYYLVLSTSTLNSVNYYRVGTNNTNPFINGAMFINTTSMPTNDFVADLIYSW